MAQARRKKVSEPILTPRLLYLAREAALFGLGAVALYIALSLITYSPDDPSWSHTGSSDQVANLGGRFGAWFADLLLHGFGYVSFLLPMMVAALAWRIFENRRNKATNYQRKLITTSGFLLTIIGGCGLENLHFTQVSAHLPFAAGGVLGAVINEGLVNAFGPVGATVFLLAMFLAGVTFFTNLSWFWLMDFIGERAFWLLDRLKGYTATAVDRIAGARARHERREKVTKIRERIDQKKPPRIEPRIQVKEDSGRLEREKQSNLFETKSTDSTVIPPLSLLDPVEPTGSGYSHDELEAMSRLLEKKLADFNVEVEVVAVHPGPVITRFEIEPAPGIKASQIQGLSRDLARALSTVSVRVVDNIPGKTVIGLEVPNETRETVRLIEGLSARSYEDANTPLALMLGKDISGVPTIADLSKMPHLLIAGTTGAGKSVCINALILSMVYKSTPRDVRFIMVDPKMLELSVYDGIPHLLAPVVTDMKEAANALRWCIAEMDRRYRLMAALGVRNVAGFNRKVFTAAEQGSPISDPLVDPETDAEPLTSLEYIVVVIDELADLMMVVGKKVEELITRLAQKGRASGIHLVLATQRPSVDVITGLIKANIPSRIAFQVSSRVDSRTVLDQIGAEQLLGHGDMLYLPPGTSVPVRVHGSFVSDQEVHRVVEFLKKAGEPDYEDEVLTGPSQSAEGSGDSVLAGGDGDWEDDPLYDQALRLVTETRRASISAVQRQLRVGYNRAARMIEAMEQAGVVGPLQSNGKREVLAPPPPED